jgi:hypothetical protein
MCARDDTPGLLECPDSCDSSIPLSDCGCKVNKLLTNETDWENVYYCVLSAPNNRANFERLMPEALIKDLVYTIATTTAIEGTLRVCWIVGLMG